MASRNRLFSSIVSGTISGVVTNALWVLGRKLVNNSIPPTWSDLFTGDFWLVSLALAAAFSVAIVLWGGHSIIRRTIAASFLIAGVAGVFFWVKHRTTPIPAFLSHFENAAREHRPTLIQIYPMLNDGPNVPASRGVLERVRTMASLVDSSRFKIEYLWDKNSPHTASPPIGSFSLKGICTRWDPDNDASYLVDLQLDKYSGINWELQATARDATPFTHPDYPRIVARTDCSYDYPDRVSEMKWIADDDDQDQECNIFQDQGNDCRLQNVERHVWNKLRTQGPVTLVKNIVVETEKNTPKAYLFYVPAKLGFRPCASALEKSMARLEYQR